MRIFVTILLGLIVSLSWGALMSLAIEPPISYIASAIGGWSIGFYIIHRMI